MASNYPGSLDNFSTSHADGVNETIHASTVNDLADAVNKIESTLGANPVLTSNFSKVRKVTSSTTATSTDYQILGDATTAGITVTLPAASSSSGQRILIRKIDSTTNHNVTVAPAGTDTIDGVNANIVIKRQYDEIEIVSDGTGWQRVSSSFGNANSSGPNASVYYVDSVSGNDSWDGRYSWRPKKTIGAAIGSYRTVHVACGVYTETVDIGGCTGLRLLGSSSSADGFSSGTNIVAPSDTTSALKASSAAQSCEIAYIGLVGSRTGTTYTGTVWDATNMTIGCHFHDITVNGIFTDFTGAKIAIGPGTYGGTGLLLDNCEQACYNNITIQNCNRLIYVPGSVTLSKIEMSNIHLGQGFTIYVENSGGTSVGDNFYRNWKTQNVFGLTYAVAQLNSNGSNPADGDTVTVRDKTYRFKNTMALANDVKIGATIDATLLSLVKAVNQTGVVGTDYFTGTTAPTGVRAGWMNLVDYGASGGNGYTNNAVDTTHHACTFQVQDVVGPAGNAYTFTVTSTNLTDYFGKGTFARAAWAVEVYFPHVWDHADMMENISLPIGNCILIANKGGEYRHLVTAPQTTTSITGSHNYLLMPWFQNSCIIQSGATSNYLFWPFSSDPASNAPSTAKITDNGTTTTMIT